MLVVDAEESHQPRQPGVDRQEERGREACRVDGIHVVAEEPHADRSGDDEEQIPQLEDHAAEVVPERVEGRAVEPDRQCFGSCLCQRVVAEDDANHEGDNADVDGEEAAGLPTALEGHSFILAWECMHYCSIPVVMCGFLNTPMFFSLLLEQSVTRGKKMLWASPADGVSAKEKHTHVPFL